ncbi:MAG: hypothetical protein ACE5M4_05910, partial [Anaerolineales bacterium]
MGETRAHLMLQCGSHCSLLTEQERYGYNRQNISRQSVNRSFQFWISRDKIRLFVYLITAYPYPDRSNH